MKRSSVFIVALVVLVGLFLLATVVYKGANNGTGRADPALLLRMHAPTLGPADAKVTTQGRPRAATIEAQRGQGRDAIRL
jgi:hypothetical protein